MVCSNQMADECGIARQSPTLGAHTHGFWVGMGGHRFCASCIQLQIGVKLLECREYANQEALRTEA